MYLCPVDAIRMEEQRAGTWFRSDTEYGPFYHAELFAGQENSGKLVSVVRQHARLRALESGAQLVLIDGPPGIGCPVIAACTGVDLALHVVEPTVSGTHDLKRILATTDHFKVPSVVAINKADLNPARTREISQFCSAKGIEIVGCVPYDTVMTDAMVKGEPVTRYTDGEVASAIASMWGRLRQLTLARDLAIIPGSSA
jgi:MinD superfamily P-loop ATPase